MEEHWSAAGFSLLTCLFLAAIFLASGALAGAAFSAGVGLFMAVTWVIVGVTDDDGATTTDAEPIATADADAGPTTEATSRGDGSDRSDALETLRERYARGELSEEQFERKLEALLKTETPERAREFSAVTDASPAEDGATEDAAVDELAVDDAADPALERE